MSQWSKHYAARQGMGREALMEPLIDLCLLLILISSAYALLGAVAALLAWLASAPARARGP